MAEWRPAYLPPDPVSQRSYAAGEIAQGAFVSHTLPPVPLVEVDSSYYALPAAQTAATWVPVIGLSAEPSK